MILDIEVGFVKKVHNEYKTEYWLLKSKTSASFATAKMKQSENSELDFFLLRVDVKSKMSKTKS